MLATIQTSLIFFDCRFRQMPVDPLNKRLFIQLSRRGCQISIGGIRWVRDESPAILAEENAQRSKGRPFVAIL